MATYNKFNIFVYDLGRGYHNLDAAGHVIKVYLSNTAPNAETMAIKSALAEFAGGTGYTAGGNTITNTWTRSTTTTTLGGTDIVWTAGAAWSNAFQYAVMDNDTQTTPVKPLIAWWDYGSALNLGNGETFTVDFGASVFTIS
jgi:hypothetical protein